ncbi:MULTISPECIES: hypothetical protein [Bradyrhizobium]|uniref:Uncharacterized protein n=1 Tax=Bradyrhizobium vignae TaxID=1549949 RepID=A0ABS4A4W2_9BRAD|nr:hypothetical protein [Bradyrhizobium vignae]MBP0115450.1 hypothetical protein [Bradyrhizobium vignae]
MAGVALCHDVLVVLALVRPRRKLGLTGLTAMLAAHVGLSFEIVFAGHAVQCVRTALVRNRIGRFRTVNELIEPPIFAVHDGAGALVHRDFYRRIGLMRKRLIVWTIMTATLVAVTVWTMLGPPDRPSSPHLPSRTAAVR